MFHAAVHYHCFWGTWEGLLWIALRPVLIKEISSVQYVKEAFWETSFWSVNSSHRVTAEFSGSSLIRLFSWNLQSEIWKHLGAHSEKEISSDNKWRETYWEIAFGSVTSSHRVPPFLSWISLLTLLSCVLQSDIWELIAGYGEKRNVLRSKLERSLLRNCILMCECNSQCYTFLLCVQFANAVFWKSASGCLWTQWSLRWQRKYPQMKKKKKLC